MTRIKISAEQPAQHLIQVDIEVPAGEQQTLEFVLPSWTPGSYFLREYAQYVRNVVAHDQDGNPKSVTKTEKNVWRVDSTRARTLTLSYDVYCFNKNVRYSFVDHDFAFLHFPSIVMFNEALRDNPVDLILNLPPHWNHTTGLEVVGENVFRADSVDHFYDSPILSGTHELVTAEVLGKEHRFVFSDSGNYDLDRIVNDTQTIIETAAQMFGNTLPYEHYTFMTLVSDNSFGGLEHANSTALMFPRDAFHTKPEAAERPVTDDKYISFLGLVSHEFFHTWNVKRIRPDAFDRFDYASENYTNELWTVEGITSYYDDLILLRAGLIDASTYLVRVAKFIHRHDAIPGRHASSLELASMNAWISLYRPDPNNHNSDVSYYLKGALVSMLLDLYIRHATTHAKSLDNVMAYMWQHHSAEHGYPPGKHETIVGELVSEFVGESDGNDSTGAFFDAYIRGTIDPDWNACFEPFGLILEVDAEDVPEFGAAVGSNRIVKSVDAGGVAELALAPGDELVAINGVRVKDLDAQLESIGPEQSVRIDLFRDGKLIERAMTLGGHRRTGYTFSVRTDATDAQLDALEKWLGVRMLENQND